MTVDVEARRADHRLRPAAASTRPQLLRRAEPGPDRAASERCSPICSSGSPPISPGESSIPAGYRSGARPRRTRSRWPTPRPSCSTPSGTSVRSTPPTSRPSRCSRHLLPGAADHQAGRGFTHLVARTSSPAELQQLGGAVPVIERSASSSQRLPDEPGHHEAVWRLPESDPHADFDLALDRLAQLAERAKFDSLFLADGPATMGTRRVPAAGPARAADAADGAVAGDRAASA